MNRYFRIFLPSLILTVTVSAAQPVQKPLDPSSVVSHSAPSMQPTANPAATINQAGAQVWNFKDMDLLSLIKQVGKTTGKNFVVNPQVKGKATFVSNQPMTPDEQYRAFLTLLQVQGYAVVHRGPIIEIVPEMDAKGVNSTLYRIGKGFPDEMMVTVKHVNSIPVDEMARLLSPMLGKSSYVGAYQPSNDLIIADRRANIDTINSLVTMIDAHSNEKMELVRLKYAPSEDLVKTLASLYTSPGRAAANFPSQVSFAADARSRSVVIRGGSAQQRAQLRGIIAKLDSPFSVTNNVTDVVYLKHLRAQNLAPILNGLVQSYIARTNAANGPSLAQQTTSPVSSLGNTGIFPASRVSSDSGSNDSNASDNTFNSALAQQLFANSGDGRTQGASVSPYIQWEDSTNSIVITAPPNLMKTLKSVIAKLDVRRPQIMIEAIIAEVSSELQDELGTELSFGGRYKLNTRFDPVMPVTVVSNINNFGTNRTSSSKSFGAGVALSYGKHDIIRVLLKALTTDSHSNVLATPNLVTLDNEPAQIKVGRKVSFAIGEINNNPSGSNSVTTSFQRQSVGLMLTIRPQITTHGAIKLVIEQELSSILPGTQNERAGGNPDTSERSIRTTVMVKDGETLILGGLLQNETQDLTSKIPVLGDIPLIGAAFRDKQKQTTKTNLMVFLRPVILDEIATLEKVA